MGPRPDDLLHQLADEHRDLTAATRGLRQLRGELATEVVRRTVTRIVEHELAHRLLVHPLLRRDAWGLTLFAERREEQLLLGDRIRRLLASVHLVPSGDVGRCREIEAVAGLDSQLVEHTDREEILAFPHLRRVTVPEELRDLGELRLRLREVLLGRLDAARSPVADSRWATTPRRELPELLDLPDDLTADLPELARGSRATGAR